LNIHAVVETCSFHVLTQMAALCYKSCYLTAKVIPKYPSYKRCIDQSEEGSGRVTRMGKWREERGLRNVVSKGLNPN